MTNNPSIVCFGEVLWDMLPSGKVAGGAPMNVAFHAKNFGIDAKMISAVGNDELGKELLAFLMKKGISTDLIHTNHTFSTSTVQVTLNEKGAASYEIVQPVAWDFLYVDHLREKVVKDATLLLFGSLIGRTENNIRNLFKLIDKAQKSVFDVNLRRPFYHQSLVEALLYKANIVKMNDEELDIINRWYGVHQEDLSEQMAFVMKKFNIETLIITKGKEGAYCMHDQQFFYQKSFLVDVKDTVGSGDSFLAAFLFKMLEGCPWLECLEFACATGALVATQAGGTPEIDKQTVLDFIKEQSFSPQ